MKLIYLDYNATTPILAPVQEAMRPFLERHYGNPSSSHAMGRACAEAVADAREQVAALVGATPEEIVFTSGGTESNNLALLGSLLDLRLPIHLIVSAVEHPAVMEPAKYLARRGIELTVVSCDRYGMIDPAAVKSAIRPHTRLVSVMHANNETGTIQPIAEISRICRARGIQLHCDAAQSVGKLPIDVPGLGIDLLSLAGHKMYAPKGIGVLCVREGVHLEPLLRGAGHESGLRAGTENVASIVGIGHAATLLRTHQQDGAERLQKLRDQLHARLKEGVGDELLLIGHPTERLPNTLNVAFPGVVGRELLARTPDVCASTGSACHGDLLTQSPTMDAMQIPAHLGKGAVRLSVGWPTSEKDVLDAADALIASWDTLRD
ncbi:MAG: cysteine desulfurase family protein [Planctomycetota bacterium]|nr:cysteine desulfurase family protein [Planctomycetota bacterium]MDA1177832.1 cysteine desulfurase family protein [Planctomycetota bacterium]